MSFQNLQVNINIVCFYKTGVNNEIEIHFFNKFGINVKIFLL